MLERSLKSANHVWQFFGDLTNSENIKRIQLIFSSSRKCLGTIHKSCGIFRLSLVYISSIIASAIYLQKTSGELQLTFKYLRWLSVSSILVLSVLICTHVTLFCTGFAKTLHSLFNQFFKSVVIIRNVIQCFMEM